MKQHHCVLLTLCQQLCVSLFILVLACAPGHSAQLNEVDKSAQYSAMNAEKSFITNKDEQGQGTRPILLQTDVHAEITAQSAFTKVKQVFKNTTDHEIDCRYFFPLTPRSSVQKNMVIVGRSKPTPGQAQRFPNGWSTEIEKVPAGETIEVDLEYFEKVAYTNEIFSYRFPKIPRLQKDSSTEPMSQTAEEDLSATTEELGAVSEKPKPVAPPPYLSISMKVNTGAAIKTMHSSTHGINIVLEREGKAIVNLKNDNAVPNNDFILEWTLAGTDVNVGWIAQKEKDADGYFALVLIPPTVKKHNGEIDTHAKLEGPVLSDLKVKQYGLHIHDFLPAAPNALLSQTPLYLIGHYNKPVKGKILVSGLQDQEQYKKLIGVALPAEEEHEGVLEKMWQRENERRSAQDDRDDCLVLAQKMTRSSAAKH